MTPQDVEALFTRNDGSYAFARWGRPIAPIVFGVEEATLKTVKGAVEALVTLAGHQIAETDPELGANLMVFFFRDWSELSEVPDLDKLIPGLPELVKRLSVAGAAEYRAFRFDETGAIKAHFVFLCMNSDLSRMPADAIALNVAVRAMLTWGDHAFETQSPLALHPENGATILRPEIAAVIAAAYDRMMPVAAGDESHALRLFARLR